MPIHDLAARGFQSGADAYERGRPSYPAAAIEFLVETLDLRAGTTLVDLGAGTGKLTRLLVPSGARIIAVEPVEAMRRRLEDQLAEASVVALDGTAEAMPLPDAAVDAIVVGQAFHWFASEAALGEMQRVLRPGGRLGLVWNVRDESVPWIARLTALTDRYSGDTPRYRDGGWRAPFASNTAFEPLEERSFPNPHEMDEPTLVDRVASVSFIAALDDGSRQHLLEEVRALVRSEPETRGERITFPYRTHVYWTRRSYGS